MIDGWFIVFIALAYIGLLFGIARWADNRASGAPSGRKPWPAVYALSLAVFCTSWTFFGSVGLAATHGFDFVPVYLGPILMFALATPVVLRVVRISKAQNITSVADFIAARYGKDQRIAVVVTVIAIIGTLPYLALQLKAVSQSVAVLLGGPGSPMAMPAAALADIAFLIALSLAGFAVLFGTRHLDATEHQEGLILAVAVESVVKLVAFLAVGLFVVYGLFDGWSDLRSRAAEHVQAAAVFDDGFHPGVWVTVTLLSFVCALLLPRQFFVAVVENQSEDEVRRAAWMFPLYLVAINIFVLPIAMAGLIILPSGSVDPDMFMLALPLYSGSPELAVLAFLGGLSAATAMVIVASVAIAIMVSNDLVLPIVLRTRDPRAVDGADLGSVLLTARRVAIFTLLLLAFVFYRMVGDAFHLASIGLLSFAAIAQFAPAFFGGLIWRRGTARGALMGIVTGFGVWVYTLMLPAFAKAGWLDSTWLIDGPFGMASLRPEALFGLALDPLSHGVLVSLAANTLAFIVFSLQRAPKPIERLQANAFISPRFPVASSQLGFRPWQASVTVAELKDTVARYLGRERTDRAFAEFASQRRGPLAMEAEADLDSIRFAEHLLASAIGAASSRLVMSLLMRRHTVDATGALKLLDDASEAIQYNRDLLQSAIDEVGQGLAVFDRDLRLICWNRYYRDLLDLPSELARVGVPLDRIIRHSATRGDLGPGSAEALISDRVNRLVVTMETFQERFADGRRTVEIRTNPMPQGGIVTTITDITERVEATAALARANETLERRVRERTQELTGVNRELAEAKAKADHANLDKTRFLAAASHDILQPLNAARLYITSLVERNTQSEDRRLVRNIDASLEAVEEILGALLDISRLDTGAMRPDITTFALQPVLDQLKLEFDPIAMEKRLDLRMMPTRAWVHSDRRLLRRLLQNLMSNAIKYTHDGAVLVGVRRRGGMVEIQVLDTGPGIPVSKQALIFKEFQRLDHDTRGVRGLGLGLSIVERIGRVLDHPIGLRSEVGMGSVFSVVLPRAEPDATSEPVMRARSPSPLNVEGMRVLCIDNEPEILDAMATLLSSWGCDTVTATGPEAALDKLGCGNGTKPALLPEIILADYHLNDTTGLEAIAAVRDACGAAVPALLITADRSDAVQDRIRRAGLQALRKPVKPAALRAVIAQTRLQRVAAE